MEEGFYEKSSEADSCHRSNDHEFRSFKFLMKGIPLTIVFRLESSRQLGLGHLMRCVHLADGIRRPVRGVLVTSAVSDGDDTAHDPARRRGWVVETLPARIECDTDAAITAEVAHRYQADLVITDLCHRYVLERPEWLPAYHIALRRATPTPVISIEDWRIGSHSSHCAVIPYAPGPGCRAESLYNCRILAGTRYFFSAPDLPAVAAQPFTVSERVRRLLVSIGGSDPKGLVVKVVRALSQLNESKLVARVVLGPALIPATAQLVRDAGAPWIEVVSSVSSMAKMLAWADLAVLGEGLVKFEAAAVGTPAIILSQFDHDSVVMQGFIGLGTCYYVGAGDVVDETQIADTIKSLIEDSAARARLSQAGRCAFDGRGLQRIAAEAMVPCLMEAS